MSPTDERGDTFIEILIAMVIMGIVVVAVIGSMGTSTAASGSHRRQADAHAILTAAADRLKSNAEVAYVPCALKSNSNYLGAIQAVALPSVGFTSAGITITDIQYWNGGLTSPEFSSVLANCKDNVADANGNLIYRLQLITIGVANTTGSVSETLSIIKDGT